MSSSSYWPKPPRLVGNIDSRELVRWHLRLAIICMDDGSATTLANKLGVTPNTVHLAVHRGSCTDDLAKRIRSEEHTSELQSLMRISYAVFCLKTKKQTY